MNNRRTKNLFAEWDEPASDETISEPSTHAPLAERMRPRTLAEFVGQNHLTADRRILRTLLEGAGALPSLILWGAPGTGKTTLARLLARRGGSQFVALSAVFSGVREVRAAIADAAEAQRKKDVHTILFLDEIHRFNKAQQDALLPAVEAGTITLVGATTENPSFEINSALLSRCRVLVLNPLTSEETKTILRRALEDHERGIANLLPRISDENLKRLAASSGGDARVALNALEAATLITEPDTDSFRTITHDALTEALGRARYAYDKAGEEHYNLASALIKSLRNSDANAALYWLARLIEGGADPVFIARRLCIFASEDIGLADPQAIVQASAAAQITHLIGLPEALYPLSQATIYLARAPKSNSVKRAYMSAREDAEGTASEPVPLHLRNAITELMKREGYGKGYRYVHDDRRAREEMTCLPEKLHGRVYYEETETPDEA
ncbi:MAG: replication-associated recombination protein A [Pyrinomonadaceae bacterium]